jgi:hypothetical protein
MTWLTDLVDQHSELESPRSFWYWSGLCAISAVLKDQVWLDRGGAYKLYPNIYVMLHADSGLKKGPPVGLAKDLVKRVNNTRIISGRSSIQGILKELGTAYTIPGGKVVNKSVGFIVASEFSSSLVNDPAAMTILTDLYDRQWNEGEWRSLLKMETFNLKDPTISMLVATNKAHFEDFIDRKDIHGGFIGRMFMIAETEVQQLNPLIKKMLKVPNKDELTSYLKELTKLNGPFESLEDKPSGKLYEEWYLSFYRMVKDQRIEDPTGTIQRFGDSVLKIAMLLSLADKPTLIINEDHMNEAISVCEKLISGIRKTTMGKTKKDDSNTDRKTLLINELMLRENHSISRLQLNKKYWMHGNTDEWDECCASLEVAGMVTIESIGNQIIIRMPETQYQEMKRFLEGKDKR